MHLKRFFAVVLILENWFIFYVPQVHTAFSYFFLFLFLFASSFAWSSRNIVCHCFCLFGGRYIKSCFFQVDPLVNNLQKDCLSIFLIWCSSIFSGNSCYSCGANDWINLAKEKFYVLLVLLSKKFENDSNGFDKVNKIKIR